MSKVLMSVVLLALAVSPVLAQDSATSEPETRPAAPLAGNPRAPYPEAAWEDKIEGVVKFRAMIDESGAVQKVDILQVPKEGVGFEDAVRSTVMGWKFEPALLDGEPIPWIYNGELTFLGTLPYDRARMYRRSSAEIWRDVFALLKELDIARDRVDERNGVLVTKAHRFHRKGLRRPHPPKVEWAKKADLFELYIYIPPFVEPARVYIDSVAYTKTRIVYRTGAPGEWLFEKLEQRIEERGQAIPESPAGRASLARQLLGETNPGPCGEPAGDVKHPLIAGAGTTLPERIASSYYRPVFPVKDRAGRREGKVIMTAIITEDGVVRDVKLLQKQGEADEIDSSATGAASLWRYKPALADGCPIEVSYVIRMDFTFGD